MKSPLPALVFKYLSLPNGLGGRGGVQRFFLLSQNIPFEEQLIQKGSSWTLEKERLMTTNENPCGTLPIIYHEKNQSETNGASETPAALIQHIAASRYLAHVYGRTSGDPYRDYVQDMVADEYQGFRDQWVRVSFSGTNEEKTKYRQQDMPHQLNKFDRLYAQFKTHEVYLSVGQSTGQPLWGDAAMFGLLYDHMLTGHVTQEELGASYGHLSAMYESYANIPAIKGWIEQQQTTNKV